MSAGRSAALNKVLWVVGLSIVIGGIAAWTLTKKRNAQPSGYGDGYIPNTPAILTDMATLDLRHALVFQLLNGDCGYVYFKRAGTQRAEYATAMRKKSNGSLSAPLLSATGIVVWGEAKDSGLGGAGIPCGDIHVRWLPATSVVFLEDMSQVAVVPITDALAVLSGSTNSVQWSSVDIPTR